MRLLRRSSAVTAALLLATAGFAAAQPAPAERCRIGDDRLDELSGLSSDGESWFAVNDGGSELEVYVLDPADCSVRDVRTADVDPYDVEDLAIAQDGTAWLADIGDNGHERDDVVLHALSPKGTSKLYRLTYPNGAHDAEALLLDRSGVPYIVTKEPFGPAGVYRPAGELAQDRAVPLERVASVSLRSTRTPGGPMSGTLGSVLVTGGAVSHDGMVAAIRTYTEAYLFAAPDGDLAAALNRDPVAQIPLPNEPQGEALAWEPDGTLLSATEGVGQPVRALPAAAAAAHGTAPPPSDAAPQGGDTAEASPQPEEKGFSNTQLLVVGIAIAALVVYVSRRARRSR
ncbi:hypothetical protein [Saccharopolyspora taberi]|uniref:Esterase-like activity of phytase family protein n=1 Tax=Saccharopolyspora taberi TaxID=60895 RepID=A0ABN3VIL3_9PSEU